MIPPDRLRRESECGYEGGGRSVDREIPPASPGIMQQLSVPLGYRSIRGTHCVQSVYDRSSVWRREHPGDDQA